MKKLMHYLFLSCRKATDLINKKSDSPLSCIENIQLSMHKSMCKACSNYEKQTNILDQAINSAVNKEDLKVDVEALKEQIHHRLDAE